MNRYLCNGMDRKSLVPAVGIEPTTNGLQIAFVPKWSFVNQILAALANTETGIIQSQLRHSQPGEGTLERKGDWLHLRFIVSSKQVVDFRRPGPSGADAALWQCRPVAPRA
jgi:hypothetical protein